jgi:AmmeMemoRadiSam system protein A
MNRLNHQAIAIAALMPHAPVLVPAVGGRRGNRANTSVEAMATVAQRVVAARPDALVLVSPHTPRRRGAFAIWAGARISGSLGRFGAPEAAVELPADEALAVAIAEEAGLRSVETWWLREGELDHGATVPLWHLAHAGWRGPTVLIGLNYPGEPGLVELGQAIAAAAQRTGRRLAVVASGDMSHRLQPGAPAGFHPRAQEFDHAFIACLRAGQYRRLQDLDADLQELAAEDAVDSTLVAAAAVNWNATGHEVLSYEGPFGVGYGVAILHQPAPPSAAAKTQQAEASDRERAAAGHVLPRVARRSLEAAFGGQAALPAIPVEGLLAERLGVFVTIRGPGEELRGCVGTLAPQFKNTTEETWQLAREAAFRDHRFAAVGAHELEHLRFEVSVVLPPEEVSSPAELDPQRYGVVVLTADGRRGALLPEIEGVETVQHQLEIARRKAGIGRGEPVRLQRFAVLKFREENWN